MGYEEAKNAIQTLAAAVDDRHRDDVNPSRNEAKTRLDLIDTVLFECLGWPNEHCEVEHHQQGQFADYVLGYPAYRVVLEAKREGITFSLPSGWDKASAKLSTLCETPNIEAAIHQALEYAQQRGISSATVSNGHQYIIFIASRQDGLPPLDGRALVFSSLQEAYQRFQEFWDALSPKGTASFALHRMLRAEERPLPPDTLSRRLVDYPGYKNRNPIASELQVLGGLFIEDLLRDPEIEPDFLKYCYVSSGSLSQHALVSREILEARYALLEETGGVSAAPARKKNGIAEDLTQDMIAAALSRRPIILLGSVGVGKSIFIRHLVNVEVEDISERAVVLYVDFGERPALSSDLNNFTLEEMRRQLLEHYEIDIEADRFVRGVYHGDLKRFENGIYGPLKETDPGAYASKELEYLERLLSDKEEHLKASLTHLQKAQKRQTVVFLDNVDQRSYEFQEEVFLIAQSIAASWPATCFVSLRPDTFYRSRATGKLSAYQPRVFTISPPRVDRVIQRRLEYAMGLIEEKGILPGIAEGVNVRSETLERYLTVLLRAFEENDDIIEFVDNMSGGNVRKGLDFVSAFIGSGHVDSRKILEAEENGGYYLPLHEFMRAVIFGDYEHYDPDESPVVNVFDIFGPDGREHFLACILLRFVERLGNVGDQDGYTTAGEVYKGVQGLGYQPVQIAWALERLIEKECLERHVGEESPVSERYRITSAGAYTVKRLVEMFPYVDAMIVDTPIVDPGVRERIGDATTIEERLARAEFFLDYLDSQWEFIDGSESGFDWALHSRRLRDSFVDIRRRAARARSRRSST